MANEPKKPSDRAVDAASIAMIEKAACDCVETCFTRMDTQKTQCGFGTKGVCCKICHMGPCKITPKSPRGVCGADADTIVARNFLREVSGGTAAHSDHARHLVLLLKNVAEGHGGGYAIKDERTLRYNARLYKIEEIGRTKEAVALDLANLFLSEFTSQETPLKTLQLAPPKRQAIWEKQGVIPFGIDRMVVEALHRTTMGVDHDYRNLLRHAFCTSLADGWGGARIGSIVSDIIFGTPTPVRSSANLGVLGEKTVNIIVHGHEPALSDMLAVMVNDPEIKAYAKAAGAEGVTLAGLCCTANEILMRHGVPIAGNFLQQELAIITGAVEMMVVDVQCCMPSLPQVAKSYHTEVVSTADMAKTAGATHMAFDEHNGPGSAKAILKRAIDNYKNRDPQKVLIPKHSEQMVAGFSVEAIKYMLGGSFRASFRPLNDAIMQGRIRGVVGIVGCNNPKSKSDEYTNDLTTALIKENVLVLKTGCSAISSGKRGWLTPETALQFAGAGLREVCETVGIPPILHMGSCVDNSRLLEAATEIVWEGGLGDDLAKVPAVGVAPEWMSEKAIAIGCYFVASGVDVILGHPFYISGSENVTNYLNAGTQEDFGASFHVCDTAQDAAARCLKLLDEKREKLGINRKTERKLLDMKDRRGTNV
jgi:carbon-monoxide dehydrogenase catalytic subunit